VEQHPTLAVRSARRTVSLQRYLEDVGLHLGGRPGERFAERCKVAISRMTLIRLVGSRAQRGYRLPEPPVTTPKVLGIDDFGATRSRAA